MAVHAVLDADAAVEQLYAAHWRSLVRLSVLLVRDAGTAEEVVQDAFVAMHGRWSRLREPDKALAYLRQAVVNRSRSALRHRAVVEPARPPRGRSRGPPRGRRRRRRRSPTARRDAVLDAMRQLPDPAARGDRAALLPRPVRGRDRRRAGHQHRRGEEPRVARGRRPADPPRQRPGGPPMNRPEDDLAPGPARHRSTGSSRARASTRSAPAPGSSTPATAAPGCSVRSARRSPPRRWSPASPCSAATRARPRTRPRPVRRAGLPPATPPRRPPTRPSAPAPSDGASDGSSGATVAASGVLRGRLAAGRPASTASSSASTPATGCVRRRTWRCAASAADPDYRLPVARRVPRSTGVVRRGRRRRTAPGVDLRRGAARAARRR